MSRSDTGPTRTYHPNAGWIAGLLVIAGVLGVGAMLWFTYHPW